MYLPAGKVNCTLAPRPYNASLDVLVISRDAWCSSPTEPHLRCLVQRRGWRTECAIHGPCSVSPAFLSALIVWGKLIRFAEARHPEALSEKLRYLKGRILGAGYGCGAPGVQLAVLSVALVLSADSVSIYSSRGTAAVMPRGSLGWSRPIPGDSFCSVSSCAVPPVAGPARPR